MEELRHISREEFETLTDRHLEDAPFTKALVTAFRETAEGIYTIGWQPRGSDEIFYHLGIDFFASPQTSNARAHASLQLVLGGHILSGGGRRYTPTPNRVAAYLQINPTALREIGIIDPDNFANNFEAIAEDLKGVGFINPVKLKPVFPPTTAGQVWLFDFINELRKASLSIDPRLMDPRLAQNFE